MNRAVEAWRAWVAENNMPAQCDDRGGCPCYFCDRNLDSFFGGIADHDADCPYRLMREEIAAENGEQIDYVTIYGPQKVQTFVDQAKHLDAVGKAALAQEMFGRRGSHMLAWVATRTEEWMAIEQEIDGQSDYPNGEQIVRYDLSPPSNIDGVAGGPLFKPEK